MKTSKMCRLILLLLALALSTGVYAQSKPRWVKKGVKELNNQRLNDTYQFRIFHMEHPDEGVLVLDRFAPLISYVDSAYNLPANTPMTLDSIADASNGRTTYTLSFNDAGRPRTVYAQRVDQFTQLDDFVLNHFEYNYYQLYAISEPGVDKPQFDDFTVTRSYNKAKATLWSIIPGMGQVYKGQNVKGWIFFSTDIALWGVFAMSVNRYHHYKDLRDKTGSPDWHNEITTFKELRAFSLIAAAGLWVYNIFDAAFCPISRRVEISRPNTYNASFSWQPVVTPDPISGSFNVGLGLDFTF